MQKSTSAVSIIRAIAIDSKSRSWKNCAIVSDLPLSRVDFGLDFLQTSPSVSKLFLPAIPKLAWGLVLGLAVLLCP